MGSYSSVLEPNKSLRNTTKFSQFYNSPHSTIAPPDPQQSASPRGPTHSQGRAVEGMSTRASSAQLSCPPHGFPHSRWRPARNLLSAISTTPVLPLPPVLTLARSRSSSTHIPRFPANILGLGAPAPLFHEAALVAGGDATLPLLCNFHIAPMVVVP
jgi:hypothetical protein